MATQNTTTANNASNEFNWQNYINDCRRHWWWFVVSVVVICGLGLPYTQLKAPWFQVEANVLIADESGEGGSLSLMKQFDISSMLGGTGSVDNEKAIMGSHTVIMETVKELNLNCTYYIKTGFLKTLTAWTDVPVQLTFDKALTDSLKAGILIKLKVTPEGIADINIKYGKKKIVDESGITLPYTFSLPFGNFTLEQTNFFPAYTAKGDNVKETIVLADYSSTAEVYQKLIGISEINKKADIINLSIKSDNPAYAKKIITSVINNYNQSGIKQQREKGLTTVRFLDERLTDLFADLQNQEKIMEQFKHDHNLSHVEADAALAIERSAEYQEKLLGAELSLEMMKLVKGFITDPANNKSFIPSVGSSSGAAVQDAINGYNSMITQRMQLSQAAKSDNLALQQLDLNIDALRSNINITLDRSIETAEVQLADLRREAGRAKNLKGMIPQTEREYIDLERRQEMLQKLYLYLLQQREEKALSTANLQPRGVIVDEAYILAAPLKLSPVKAIVIFLFLGLIIPAGLLFLRERMRKNICSANEVKAMCDSIPVLAESSNKSWCTELASAAKYMLGAVDGKCVMVTSPGNDPNTAQTAAELSDRLSAGGNKVLLIDTDTLSDSLCKALGIKSQPGLNEYLSGLCQLSDAIQHKSGIDIIASGGKAPNHAELLFTKRMADLMNHSAESYDYIVVTTPEMLANADSSIIAEYAAATVIVVTENVTSITDIETATNKVNTGIFHSTGIMYFNA